MKTFDEQIVQRLGGQNRVTANNQWRQVCCIIFLEIWTRKNHKKYTI